MKQIPETKETNIITKNHMKYDAKWYFIL